MSKVFFGTLLSQANNRLQEVPVFLHRAGIHFLPERSINSAIRELQETISILEKAKQSYLSQTQNQTGAQCRKDSSISETSASNSSFPLT